MKQSDWKQSIRYFLTAQTISLFGSALVQYAIVWYITLTTSSGKMLTLSTVCGFLPQILISLFAGVWTDRYDRKKMIMLSDAVIAISTLFLAVFFLLGFKDMKLLLIVLAVRSMGTGIQNPAVNAVIPQIVPEEQLLRINGINSVLSSMIMFLSPAVSGAVLSVAPLETVLLIDVFTAVIGISITAFVKIHPYERKIRKVSSGLLEIKYGFQYLHHNRPIKRLLISQLVLFFLISPSAFLTPLMVSRTFGTQVWRLTASEMTYSLGMVLGGLLIASWGGFHERMKTVIAAGILYGIFMIGLGSAPLFPLYLICNVLIGMTAPCYQAPINTILQQEVETGMQGRIFSFMQITTSCALPFGMVFFGPLADQLRIQTILLTAGAAVVGLSLFIWKSGFLLKRESQ